MTNNLYLVHLDGPSLPRAASHPDLFELAPGLYLFDDPGTRSQVYHALKRQHAPERLLVAPLSAAPKFKGMTTGALAWLRERGYR